MRKLLSLVLAFAMILGTFAFPVSADGDSYQAVGEELKTLGVLSGDQNGDLKADNELTREEALVVLARLMGKLDEAQATEAESGFADVPAGHWAAKIIAYAKAQKWVAGKSETEFGLGQKVTTKEALSFMMRALGYEADWAKEDIMKKASELGLMKDVTAEADKALLRGELFVVMKNTLYTKPMGEKTELIYKLGLAENPVPETLEVVDVKAENLKEIIVEFNQEVDKDTLEDAFSSVGLNLSKVEINVQEDGKTVVLSLDKKMRNKSDYKITISKVKSLGGVQMEKVMKEFKTQDNEVPKVEKFVVTGPKEFKIHFSEPVQPNMGKVKLTLKGKTGPGASVTGAGRVVTVKASSNFKDGETYGVLVTGFVDYAGYKNIDTEMDLEYAKVTTAPTVEVVKATQEYVVLKFDRPVKGLEKENFYHTYSAWKPVLSYGNVKDMLDDTLKGSIKNISKNNSYTYVVIRFLEDIDSFVKKANDKWHPLPVGDVEVNVLGQVGARKVVDNWGNQLQDTELMVNITADKTAPVIESVEATSEKQISVRFSKEIVLDQNNFEVLNENGSKFGGSVTVDFDKTGKNKVVVLTLNGSSVVGKTVILNVKNVKDATINMNKLVGTESFNVTFGDKSFENIKEVVLHEPKDGVAKMYVVFGEAMDAESATNIKNYKFTVNADVEKEQFSIEADTSMHSDSVVLITMDEKVWDAKFKPYAYRNTVAPKQVLAYTSDKKVKGVTNNFLRVVLSNNVKDLAGNSFGNFTLSEIVKASSNVPTIAVDTKSNPKVVATSRNTIEIEFDQPVMATGQGLAAKAFKVYEGLSSNPANERVVENAVVKGDLKRVVELTLKDELKNTTTETINISYDATDVSADEVVVNELEKELPDGVLVVAGKVKDGIAPEYKPEKKYDASGKLIGEYVNAVYTYTAASKSHKIVVKFTEALDFTRIGRDNFVLVDANGDKHEIKSYTVTATKDQVTLNFELDDNQMDRFTKRLKAIVTDLEATPLDPTGQGYKQMFNLKIDGKVTDTPAGNDLTRDEIQVYFENTNDIKALTDASDYAAASKVTKAEFKAMQEDKLIYTYDTFVPEYELKNALADGETVKFVWMSSTQEDTGFAPETGLTSATNTDTVKSTLPNHATTGLDNEAVGVKYYKVRATITNGAGFTSVAEDVFKVEVKAPNVTVSLDEANPVQEDAGTADKVIGKVVLTLEGAEFIDATLDQTNFTFTGKKKDVGSTAVTVTATAVIVDKTATVATLTFDNVTVNGGEFDEDLELTIILLANALKAKGTKTNTDVLNSFTVKEVKVTATNN